MTETRKDIIQALSQVQNTISAPIDIMTITGSMSDNEIRAHLEYYIERIQRETDKLIGKRHSRRRH